MKRGIFSMKRVVLFLILGLLITLTGCSSSKSTPSTTSTITSSPTATPAKIEPYLKIIVQYRPLKDQHYCHVVVEKNDRTTPIEDAVVKINGTTVPYIGQQLGSYSIEPFYGQPGVNINYSVSHPSFIKTLEGSFKMPLTPSGLTCSAEQLTNWVNRTEKTLDLGWDPVKDYNVSNLLIHTTFYDAEQKKIGGVVLAPQYVSNSRTLTEQDTNTIFNACTGTAKYVKIQIAVNRNIKTSNIEIYTESLCSNGVTNLPSM